MIDSLTTENQRDFATRYNGTWGFYVPDSGNKVLVRVKEVTRDGVSFCDSSGGTYMGYIDRGMQFEFIPINKGFYNGKTYNVYWLARHPQRQWQRGIHANNTICNVLTEDGKVAVDFSTALPEIFDPKVDHQVVTRQAYEEYKNKKRNIFALSKHFAIAGSRCFFYDTEIGTVQGDAINVINSIVLQELSDVVRRNNFQFEVANV